MSTHELDIDRFTKPLCYVIFVIAYKKIRIYNIIQKKVDDKFCNIKSIE